VTFFRKTVLGKPGTRVLCLKTSSQKSCLLWNNVKKYGTARQATDDNIIRRMRISCRITRVRIETYFNIKYILVFHSNNGYAESPRCYITRKLLVLVLLSISSNDSPKHTVCKHPLFTFDTRRTIHTQWPRKLHIIIILLGLLQYLFSWCK